MSPCKTLVRTSLSSAVEFNLRSNQRKITSTSYQHFRSFSIFTSPRFPYFFARNSGIGINTRARRVSSRLYSQVEGAVSLENADFIAENVVERPILEPHIDISKDTVEKILSKKDDVASLMKMERVLEGVVSSVEKRWFPYLDSFNSEGTYLSSGEILEAIDPLIMEVRKERFKSVVANRTYSVCLVVEGLADYGNVSATLRSADALGFQSVHVISCDSKRYRDNRHVSMGAEKWLDIELWDSTQECFDVLHSRGYRIATTHVGIEAVSIYDMDWSCPTAIVVGNENRGISEEALELSDFHCSIPMKGMVDSFNVSVAAGILMHQAVCDRTSRLGCHGDLTPEQRQILLAEFSLRHSKSAICIAHQYAKRKAYPRMPNL